MIFGILEVGSTNKIILYFIIWQCFSDNFIIFKIMPKGGDKIFTDISPYNRNRENVIHKMLS